MMVPRFTVIAKTENAFALFLRERMDGLLCDIPVASRRHDKSNLCF